MLKEVQWLHWFIAPVHCCVRLVAFWRDGLEFRRTLGGPWVDRLGGGDASKTSITLSSSFEISQMLARSDPAEPTERLGKGMWCIYMTSEETRAVSFVVPKERKEPLVSPCVPATQATCALVLVP